MCVTTTFQFRNCHGKFFCSFRCIHGNNSRAVSVWGKRLHTKTSLPLCERYLRMGKRVGVTTTIIVPLVCGFRRQDLLAWHELFANFYELKPRVCQISPKHSWNNDKRKYVGKLWYLRYLKYLSCGVHLRNAPRVVLASFFLLIMSVLQWNFWN